MATDKKENKAYPEDMLTKLDGDIIVLVGRTTTPTALQALPRMQFKAIDYTKRGIIINPEGYACEEKRVYNDSYNLVCNCQAAMQYGFHGVIVTNSHYVVEAIHLYSRMYGVRTRFFLADNETSTIIEHTDDLEPVYTAMTKVLDKLDDDKEKLTKIVDEAGDRAKRLVEEALDKNTTLANEMLDAVRDAVNGVSSSKPAPELSNSIVVTQEDVIRIVENNIVFDCSSSGHPIEVNSPVAVYDDTYHHSNDIRLVAYGESSKVFVPTEAFTGNTWSIDKLGDGRVMLRCWKGYPSTVYWEGSLYTNFASIGDIADKLKNN